MATFVQGVAPISYKPVVFDLDFAYMERMLKMRQNMYNKGAAKVKNLYDSLFSSSMLREDNIAKRDAYLKTISDSLKAVGGLDFSLGQNVENASKLFEPITNDEYVAKDIAYTKNYTSEISKAQRLKNSTNGEDRKQWWAEGVKALQYQAEEFKNASKDETLGMTAPRYVPQVDLLGMADKLYKEGKISVKKDIIKGGYIWTMKNGDIAYPVTQTMVSTMFAQDPAIKEAFRTQAYVRRKDYVKEHAAEFGGDETKAEEAYMEEVITNTVNKNRLQLYAEDEEVSKLMDEVSEWQELDRQGRILKGSDDEKKYQAAVDKLRVAGDALAQKKIDMTVQEINNLDDVGAMRIAVDAAVTMDTYNTLSQQIAKHLADKNKEISIKADPQYLAELRAQNAQELEILRNKNRRLMEILKQQGKLEMEDERQENRENMEETRQENRKDIIEQKETNIRTRPSKSKVKTGTPKKESSKVSDLFPSVTPYNKPDQNVAATDDKATVTVDQNATPDASTPPKRSRMTRITNDNSSKVINP
jgi:hypothetical protein